MDLINQQKIRSVIKEHGYPGRTLVGEKLQNVAFFIQHANLEMQEEFSPILLEIDAAKRNEFHKLPMLMLIDRIHLKKFGKQIHKSQSVLNKATGKYEPAPIDNTIDPDVVRLELRFRPIKKKLE